MAMDEGKFVIISKFHFIGWILEKWRVENC